MSGDLDSILNGSEQPEAAVEPVAEPETPTVTEATPEPVAEQPSGQPRDEKGRFAPKGENEGVSPTPVNEPPLDHAAVLGERRRRQQAEAELAELRKQLATPAPQPTVAPQPTAQQPSIQFDEDLYWSNPAQFLNGFAQQIRESLMQEVRSSAPTLIQEQLIDRSEQLAKARHEDYAEASAAFRNAAMVNPQLRDKLFSQADPAEFAYQEGKRLLEMANYGSTNEYIEAEVAKRLEAATKAATPAPVIPVSLADAPASGPVGEAPMRPMPLNEILARR